MCEVTLKSSFHTFGNSSGTVWAMARGNGPTSEVGASDRGSNIPLPSQRNPAGTVAGEKEEGSVEGNRARQRPCRDPVALDLSTVSVLLVLPGNLRHMGLEMNQSRRNITARLMEMWN